jgi:hypothetical protein
LARKSDLKLPLSVVSRRRIMPCSILIWM